MQINFFVKFAKSKSIADVSHSAIKTLKCCDNQHETNGRRIRDGGISRCFIVRFNELFLSVDRDPTFAFRRLNDFASAGLNADLYIVLDIPAELSRERLALAKKKKDRLELSGVDFMQKVRSGYLDISRKMENAVVVDGTENPETIHLKIREILIREMPATFGI